MARAAIEIKGLDELKRGLTAMQQEKYPSAMRNAINYTLADVKTATVARMHIDFKSPTPFTQKSMKVEEASKIKLSGRVVFKDPTRLSESQHYLYPNTYGVKRGHKPFEAALYRKGIIKSGWYAVPGRGVQLDGYGNVPASLYVQIIAFFNAFPEAGSKQNMTDATRARRKKGTKKKYGFEYFALKNANGSMLPGIYKRTYTGFGTAIDAMFIFVPPSHVWYTRQYKFHETGVDVFRAKLKPYFGSEMDRLLQESFK